MRQKQTPTDEPFFRHSPSWHRARTQRDLAVPEDTPQMLDLVYNDLIRNRRHETGHEGMTAEQVLRSCVLKQFRCLSYEELAFHLEDSNYFRGLRPFGDAAVSVIDSSGEYKADFRRELGGDSHLPDAVCAKFGIQNGRKMRIDSTAVETDIDDPTDASLLWDGIRIITRYLEEGHTLDPHRDYRYSDHLRVAKKRLLAVVNAKKESIVCFGDTEDRLYGRWVSW